MLKDGSIVWSDFGQDEVILHTGTLPKAKCSMGPVTHIIYLHAASTGWCSTPTQLLICSSFNRENGHPLLICSSLSTAQILFTYMWLQFMVSISIGKYSIHAAYGKRRIEIEDTSTKKNNLLCGIGSFLEHLKRSTI